MWQPPRLLLLLPLVVKEGMQPLLLRQRRRQKVVMARASPRRLLLLRPVALGLEAAEGRRTRVRSITNSGTSGARTASVVELAKLSLAPSSRLSAKNATGTTLPKDGLKSIISPKAAAYQTSDANGSNHSS
ncbi:hypothetical protein ASPVEDRAFT_591160 [Aspergillus versicolor CBS 583.65]|uniref:Uncharacterized protein n=1 Tax=Aspergillus versicolor CBS 583.65 TaxID=1036611 RepID=A0A1L9PH50_ASPVE|nr:uncharacterized protein ASPVEDRAFT_591160 [Aspergillus versicolor CBS 583.65]OJJ00838.1 hypothetical protein ASPVEDRAFT_591160 [Aspergillus versicolor CBS 583.65]